MTCANCILTIFAAVIFVVTVWPNIIGLVASTWVIAILAVLIVILAWTMVKCKCCKTKKK